MILISPPVAAVLDRDTEVKDQLGRDRGFTDDDDYLTGLIAAATDFVEKYMSRALITQSWRQYFDGFPGHCHHRFHREHTRHCRLEHFELWRSPAVSIDAVKYLDQTDAEQTVDPALYKDLLDVEPGIVRLKVGQGACWPFAARVSNSVWIEFTAGYGDASSDVPELIRNAMKLLIHHWYENRLPVQELKFEEMPLSVTSILDQNKVYYF